MHQTSTSHHWCPPRWCWKKGKRRTLFAFMLRSLLNRLWLCFPLPHFENLMSVYGEIFRIRWTHSITWWIVNNAVYFCLLFEWKGKIFTRQDSRWIYVEKSVAGLWCLRDFQFQSSTQRDILFSLEKGKEFYLRIVSFFPLTSSVKPQRLRTQKLAVDIL